MRKVHTVALVLAGLAVFGLFAVGSWAFTAWMLAETSGAEFCDTCHTMGPVTKAYRQDPHGGKNPYGFQAKCVDCHLPHDSPTDYIFAKAKFGLMDAWAEFLGDPGALNWAGIKAHDQQYVFDSGCRHCHSRLMDATRDNPLAAKSHKLYFEGGKGLKCFDCHAGMGHAAAQKDGG